jgi:hypothetical protein
LNEKRPKKRDKIEPRKKSVWGFWSNFVQKLFNDCFRQTWTFYKNICLVVLNPPCRETPENVLKKTRKKSGLAGVGLSKEQVYGGGGRRFLLAAPRSAPGEAEPQRN